MAYISDTVIADTVNCIMNTRDMCGDERRAALEFLADDHGLFGADAVKAYRIANYRANYRWDQAKRAADVNPKYRWL